MKKSRAVMISSLALALMGLSISNLFVPALAQTPPPAKAAGPSFKALDADRSGHLSLDEVLAYAKKKSADTQPFRINDADLDGDGKLTPEEQRKAGITGLEQFGAVDLKAMDIGGDGYISRDDLDEFFRRKHREAYARADQDGDGRVHPTEFALYRFSVTGGD